jgi:hypothetical protein
MAATSVGLLGHALAALAAFGVRHLALRQRDHFGVFSSAAGLGDPVSAAVSFFCAAPARSGKGSSPA